LLQEWRARDFPLEPIPDALPIIDPDLLIKGDFKSAILSDPAFALFKTRQDNVQAWVVELDNKRAGTATSLIKFNAMLAAVMPKQAADLVTLDNARKQGQDISGDLAALKLDMPAFNYLVRFSRLVTETPAVVVLEAEWIDIRNILVQVRKKQNFAIWRDQEKAANSTLSLSPKYFQAPATMPFVRSTGTDANGILLPEGAVDPNWTVIKPGTTTAVQTFATKGDPIWFPNRDTSRWISAKPDATTNDLPGSYTYRTSFDLTGFDPTTVQLLMQISVDDELVDVKLNNQSLGLKITTGEFPFVASHGLQINTGFISGINTLEFIVVNQNVSNNPTGIQAKLDFVSVPQRIPVSMWRATPQARQEWEAILRGRIEQEKSVADTLKTVVNAVEEATLPLLRNAIVSGTGKDADWLTQRLLIDVKADSKAQTTRLNQAIETLQNLFFGLRSSDPPVELTTWKLNWNSLPETNSLFDEQWDSIGSYAGWRAAMLVFLYPENLLIPTLRPATHHTAQFRTFLKDLRAASPLTRDTASQLVAQYFANVRASGSGFPIALPTNFTVSEKLSEADLLNWASQTGTLWTANTGDAQRKALTEMLFDLPIMLASQLQQAGDFETALDWYRVVYALELPLPTATTPDRRPVFPGLRDEKSIPTTYDQTSQWLLDSSANPHQFAKQRANAYTRFTLLSIVRCMLSYADSEFTTDSFESLPRARSLYINAREVLDMPELSLPPTDKRVKMNPVIAAFRGMAEVNLFKLRTQRNIAGMQREVPSLIAQPATLALVNGSRNGRVNSGTLAPTQYRYATLIDRAKQLVTLAQQIEASFLASLEKRDAEAYSILKARQDLELSSAHLTLQDLRVTEAADGLQLAKLQQQKSQLQVDHYQGLLNEDLSASEMLSLGFMWGQFGLQTAAAVGYTAAAGTDGILAVATLGLFAGSALEKGAQAFGAAAGAAGVQASIQDKIASYERRREDWQYQHDLGRKDKQITDQQY
ncbi:MAG TPA: neuraminidase-like domain-containing protein, partial [Pyrinomonadaceae bacterium]|nr:neuraminidase-like domain-containing protein [Pyrinomonadaceae bacterium]